MKITVENETYFPTLGVLVAKGDSVEIPDGDAFPASALADTVVSKKKSDPVPAGTSNEGVVNDGSAS